jgi:hypothetical protein
LALSELEQYINAFYLANGARELKMTPRFWPYAELVLIIEDKILFSVRQFGITSSAICRPVASAHLDLLIERQAFSTVTGSLGDRAHRYQEKEYRQVIDRLLEDNPINRRAQSAGPEFWQAAFETLLKSGK